MRGSGSGFLATTVPHRVAAGKRGVVRLALGEAGVGDLLTSDDLRVEGGGVRLRPFSSTLDRPDGHFAVAAP